MHKNMITLLVLNVFWKKKILENTLAKLSSKNKCTRKTFRSYSKSVTVVLGLRIVQTKRDLQ